MSNLKIKSNDNHLIIDEISISLTPTEDMPLENRFHNWFKNNSHFINSNENNIGIKLRQTQNFSFNHLIESEDRVIRSAKKKFSLSHYLILILFLNRLSFMKTELNLIEGKNMNHLNLFLQLNKVCNKIELTLTFLSNQSSTNQTNTSIKR